MESRNYQLNESKMFADVTDGMFIRADVSRSAQPGLHIDGGKGIGRAI